MRTFFATTLVAASATFVLTAPSHGTTAAGPAQAAAPDCRGVKATIVGSGRADRIIGTQRRDVIVGGGGADVIKGLGGNDIICGGDGADTIRGGAAADHLDGGSGRDRVIGGAGEDGFESVKGDGNDFYRGGGGKDTFLIDRAGTDSWDGGAGADTIDFLGAPRARVTGGSGDDEFLSFAGSAASMLRGGEGDDLLTVVTLAPAPEHSVTIDYIAGTITTSYDDTVTPVAGFERTMISMDGNASVPATTHFRGTPGDDEVGYVRPLSGRLFAYGHGGDDTLSGGLDNDHLNGGAGRDSADGGDGVDHCVEVEASTRCETPSTRSVAPA